MGAYGTQHYAYDAVDNRTQRVLGDGTVEQYQYAANSNRLQQVASGQGTRSFSYDARGSIQQDRRVGTAGNYSYLYNAAGRMMRVTKNGAVVASYGYDATGHRVTKVTPGFGSRVTIRDRVGVVLGEYTASGAVLNESIWLERHLLAQIDTNQVMYVSVDNLLAPFLMTDNHQSVVWQLVSDPFGVPVRITGSATLTQRFPGQRADAETGFNQNYFRDYDPMLGRYVESDPIGLSGGRNTFGYVRGNPLSYIDADGLVPNPAEAGCVFGPNPVCVAGVGVDAVTSLLVICGVIALESQAHPVTDKSGQRVTTNPIADNPPGNCTPEDYELLKQEVDQKCKMSGPLSCKSPDLSADEVKIRTPKALACALARNKINKKCFAGGNLTHRDEAIKAFDVAAQCQGRGL